ncbi:MAG: hypothetical protein ACXITV_04005 [Luteibaculaceae bacterium]
MLGLNTIFPNLPDTAKVWVYQSNRILTAQEALFLEKEAKTFAENWKSHGAALTANATVIANALLVFAVDENKAGASGCSIDSSVKFVKEAEQALWIDFFDRMQQTLWVENEPKIVHLHKLEDLLKQGDINEHTLVFDSLVNTLGKLRTEFLKPLNKSWHARFLQTA